MKKIYFLILAFLLGPPAFRNIDDNFNASSGSIDIWVYLKIISYTIILIILFNENLKIKKDIIFKKSNHNLINILFFLIFTFFLISSFYGNKFYYNTAYSILFFSGFLIYKFLFNIFENYKDF